MIQLSILIVSYNVKNLLERCLRSLEMLPPDWEVIVVDNNSKDGTKERITSHESRVTNFKAILLLQNVGFARGNIEAYKHAKGEYILLLNPDAKVLPLAIESMVRYLDQNSDVWIVGPKLLNGDGSIQRSVRGFPSLGSQILVLLKLHNYFYRSTSVILNSIQPACRTGRDPETKNKQKKNSVFSFLFSFLDSRLCGNDKGESGKNDKWCLKSLEKYLLPNFDYSTAKEVDQVMGAALMTRRNIIEQIGFLDPGFKRIFEEVDFCFRVKQAGGKVYYLPEARIVHAKGESFGTLKTFGRMLTRQYYFNQGMARFFWKHKPLWQSVILFPFLIASLIGTAILWFLLTLRIPLVKNHEF